MKCGGVEAGTAGDMSVSWRDLVEVVVFESAQALTGVQENTK